MYYHCLNESADSNYKDALLRIEAKLKGDGVKNPRLKIKNLINKYVNILNSPDYQSLMWIEDCTASYSRGVLDVDISYTEKAYGDSHEADHERSLIIIDADTLSPGYYRNNCSHLSDTVEAFLGIGHRRDNGRYCFNFAKYDRDSPYQGAMRRLLNSKLDAKKSFYSNDDCLLFKQINIHEHIWYD